VNDFRAQFPGRSQLSNNYAGVIGENSTKAEQPRLAEEQALSNEMKIAVGRHYLVEVPFDDVEAIGQSGRRWRYQGTEWRLSAEYFQGPEDPRSARVELFFIDRSVTARFPRRPNGANSGTGLSAAARGGRVEGSVLVSLDGSTTRLGRPR
jgi:hypothetical protein